MNWTKNSEKVCSVRKLAVAIKAWLTRMQCAVYVTMARAVISTRSSSVICAILLYIRFRFHDLFSTGNWLGTHQKFGTLLLFAVFVEFFLFYCISLKLKPSYQSRRELDALFLAWLIALLPAAATHWQGCRCPSVRGLLEKQAISGWSSWHANTNILSNES